MIFILSGYIPAVSQGYKKNVFMDTTAELSANAQQYYNLSRHWASDIEFFKIETVLIRHLLDNYFVRLLNPIHFENLRQTRAKLFELGKVENELRKQLSNHLKQLELVAKNIIPENTRNLADAQGGIESLVSKLAKDFREIKKELFALVERTMTETKLIAEN
jgi:hypothetical protein